MDWGANGGDGLERLSGSARQDWSSSCTLKAESWMKDRNRGGYLVKNRSPAQLTHELIRYHWQSRIRLPVAY